MIRHLRNSEIDKTRWDSCLDQSVNRMVYGYSWYLDVAAPGWDALVEDDYTAVFPLVHRRKFGISYLFQPYFTQQLGLFSSKLTGPGQVNAFLSAIPARYRFAEIHLNSMNRPDPGGFELEPRLNHELDLIGSYESLREGFSDNARRNLKKAAAGSLVLRKDVEPDELVTLFRDNFGRKEGKLKFSHYDTLRKLLETCMAKTGSRITGVTGSDGKLCAAVFFLVHRDRAIYHLAASSQVARENGAMYYLADQFIREHAGTVMTLDFEGSNDENVARFYKGFGAQPTRYYLLRYDRLPALIRLAAKIGKRLR